MIAANWLANVAPRDGTAIGIIPMATAFDNLLGNSSARFDARRFNWLVSLNDYTAVVAVWHATPFATAADLFDKELLVGGSGAASDVTVWPVLLNALIGTRTRTVRGYPGTAGITLAMERGEVQGMIGDDWASLKANKADWLREQKLRILMQLTAARHADLPDVPLAGEFATSESNARVLALFVERQQYGRPLPGAARHAGRGRGGLSGGLRQGREGPRIHPCRGSGRAHHQDHLGRGGRGPGRAHLRQSQADHRRGERAAAQRAGVTRPCFRVSLLGCTPSPIH